MTNYVLHVIDEVSKVFHHSLQANCPSYQTQSLDNWRKYFINRIGNRIRNWLQRLKMFQKGFIIIRTQTFASEIIQWIKLTRVTFINPLKHDKLIDHCYWWCFENVQSFTANKLCNMQSQWMNNKGKCFINCKLTRVFIICHASKVISHSLQWNNRNNTKTVIE